MADVEDPPDTGKGERQESVPVWPVAGAFLAGVLGQLLLASLASIIGAKEAAAAGLGQLGFAVAVVVFTTWLISRTADLSWDAIGVRSTPAAQAALFIVVGAGLLTGLFAAWAALFGSAGEVADTSLGIGTLVIIVAGATLFAPVAEEIIFRGLMLPLLLKASGVAAALIGQAVLFAFLHLSWRFLVPYIIMGLVLGIARLRTGSLLPPLGIHVLFNLGAYLSRVL